MPPLKPKSMSSIKSKKADSSAKDRPRNRFDVKKPSTTAKAVHEPPQKARNMSSAEQAAMRVELLSLESKVKAIQGLIPLYADKNYLATELAITLGQLDRLRVIARKPTHPAQNRKP